MLWTILAVLAVLWALGVFGFPHVSFLLVLVALALGLVIANLAGGLFVAMDGFGRRRTDRPEPRS